MLLKTITEKTKPRRDLIITGIESAFTVCKMEKIEKDVNGSYTTNINCSPMSLSKEQAEMHEF